MIFLILQEVELLNSSKAMKELTEEQQNLQKELESLQNEHAQRMEEFYVEQKDLEKKLEQVMKQKCTCDSNLEKDKEAEYAAQVRITVCSALSTWKLKPLKKLFSFKLILLG